MSELIKTEALVLSAMRWRESSKIVHLFSADRGYLKLIAKGVLRPKSPFRGVLETLNHVEVIFTHKDSRSLQLATGASLINAFLHIRDDLPKTGVAFSMMELLRKLFTDHEPVPLFFEYLIELLEALDAAPGGQAPVFLWHCLLQLSATLGFGWTLENCLKCKQPLKAFPAAVDSHNGGVVCRNCCGASSGNRLSVSRRQWEQLQLLRRSAPSTLAAADFKALSALQPDLTGVLLRHLSHHTEVGLELNSLKWYV